MYQGKEESRPRDIPATTWPVVKLLRTQAVKPNYGHVLWGDNWFSSIRTLLAAREAGVEYGGTMRSNRLSGAFINPKQAAKGKDNGHTSIKVVSLPGQKDVYMVQTIDKKKPIHFITGDPFVFGWTERNKKQEGKGGKYQKVKMVLPSVIMAYNKGKVGTDRMDQMVTHYYYRRRLKWPLKIILHVLMIAMNNAHISWLDCCGYSKRDHNHRYLSFVKRILQQMTDSFESKRRINKMGLGSVHTPARTNSLYQNGRKGRHLKEGERNRGPCVMCKNKITTMCLECDVKICLSSHLSSTHCWREWHNGGMHDDRKCA
jgi:hypothetical protein